MLALLLLSPLLTLAAGVVVEGRNIRIEFDPAMRSRVVAKFGGKDVVIGAVGSSEFMGRRSIWWKA